MVSLSVFLLFPGADSELRGWGHSSVEGALSTGFKTQCLRRTEHHGIYPGPSYSPLSHPAFTLRSLAGSHPLE